MKSNSINGLSYSLIPANTKLKNNEVEVNDNIDVTIPDNEIYFFVGTVPDETVLKAYNTTDEVLGAHGVDKAFELKAFDLHYKFNKEDKSKVITKVPVDSLAFQSLKTGKISWAMLRVKPKTLGTPNHILYFIKSIGTWNDDVYVTLDTLDVVEGETVNFKDLVITVRDSLIKDLA